MRSEDVAAAIRRQRNKVPGEGTGELLQGLVVGFGFQQQTRQTQLGNRLVTFIGALAGHPAQGGLGGINVALVVIGPGRQQAGLLGKGRPGKTLLHVGHRAVQPAGVSRLGGTLDLVVHHGRLGGLIALPVVVAVPGCKSAKNDNQAPGNQVTVLLPEVLQLVELLLFFQIEMFCHRALLVPPNELC